jgi:serum/glucocorticoid-regulated kinase 2
MKQERNLLLTTT